MSVLSRGGFGSIDRLRRSPILLMIPFSILAGIALTVSGSSLVAGALIVAVPVVMLEIAFVRNLFIGIVVYLIMEYLQPGFRFPALAPLRPSFLVAVALLIAWLLNAMQHRVKLVPNWQVKSYLLILIIGTLSAVTAISAGMVVRTLVEISKTLALFFIIYSVVDTVPKLNRLIWVYIILHLILGILAFQLFFTTGQRNMGDLGGTFLGDENDSAMALLVMIPYAYFMLWNVSSKRLRLLLATSIMLSSGAVLFSFSRGAFVGFSAMMLYVWWNTPHKRQATIVLLLLAAVVFIVMPGEYWERIESTKDYGTEGSAQGRIDAWKGGVKMLTTNPLFGAGLGNFNRTYGELYNTISMRWTAAHSMYVQFMGELGVPGCIFLIVTIFLTLATFRVVRRACKGRTEPEYETLQMIVRGGECGFVAYLVATIFLNSMTHPHLWHFGAISGCSLLALRNLRRAEAQNGDLGLVESDRAESLP